MSNGDDVADVNPFRKLKELKQQAFAPPDPLAQGVLEETAKARATPPANPFLRRKNPYLRTDDFHPFSLAVQHPIIQGLIVQPIEDISNFISLTFERGEQGFRERTPAFHHDPRSQMLRDLETMQWGPPTAQEEQRRQSAIRGGAFLASFAGGPILEAVPAVGAALGAWGSYATSEFIGGGLYGSIRPLDDEESRASAIFGDASLFAATGLLFKGAGEGISTVIKRRLWRLPIAQRDAAVKAVKTELSQVNRDLSAGGVRLEDLPPDARAKVEEPILKKVLQQFDPAEVNVEELAHAEADRELEISAREDKLVERLSIEAPFGKPRPLTPNEEFDKHMQQLLIEHPMGKTPPLEESAAAPPPGPEEEHIVSVAVMGKDGHVYKPKRGEITHPELMTNLIDFDGVSPNAFFHDKEGKFLQGESRGYVTSKGAYVTVDQATQAGLRKRSLAELAKSQAERGEQLVGPAVQGRSGDVYVGTTSHPEIMAQAIRDGVPKSEFKEIVDNADHPGRGFRTNKREFITREQAAELTGHPVPLFSEDMHANKMLPTESTEAAVKGLTPETDPVAALDIATNHATAQLDPLKTASPGVKVEAEELQKLIEIHGLPEKPLPKHLRALLSHALEREGPNADKVVLLGLTQPGPIETQIGRKIGSAQIKKIREQLARTLRRERPIIEVSPHERVAAPWEEVDPPLTVPKNMDGIEMMGHVRDDKLEELNKALLDAARSKGELGFIKPELMARLTAAGIGSTMEALAMFDDNLSDGEKTGLRGYGALILLASIFPGFKALAERSRIVKDVVKMYVPGRAMSAGGEVWREYAEAFTRSGLKQHEMSVAIERVFSDDASKRAAMYVIDEGPAAPEFHSLTLQQQRMAVIMNQFKMRQGLLLTAKKGIREYEDSYMRHLLQSTAYQKWAQQGGSRSMPGTSIRQLEAWATRNSLPGPLMNPAIVHSFHMAQVDRTIATTQLAGSLKQAGRIVDLPKPGQPIPPQWRELKGVPGMSGKMAPEEDAHDLGIISRIQAPKGEVLAALDRIKSRWVRSIMFWWWEHGLNAMRSYLALSFNPTKYFDGVKWLEHPAIREEMASVGVNVYGQSADYLLRVQENWKNVLGAVKMPELGARLDKLQEWNDRKLWEKVVPALQTFAYVTRMKDWVERNAGKFGGPEYLAEARRVADFVNTIAGKVPQHLADPRLAKGMRLMMFSPQWTGTRMAMWAHAAGEASDMMAGKLDPRNALYLPLKVRQLAWGVTLTYVGSMLLSGKPPEFNPNNSRFYMNTGSRDARGRAVGVDLTGWWQDEFRFFGHPFDFLMNRLNPVIKVGVNTLEGRDYLGRPMTTGQSIGNIISSFGPPAQIASDVARVARAAGGGQRIAAGDIWQMASRTLATGNVAVLPPAMNATLAKYAKKILINQGIPASSDHVFELAQRMRSNLVNGRDLIDEGTIMLLAARKRSSMWEFPLPGSAAFNGIWQEARGVLADFQQ